MARRGHHYKRPKKEPPELNITTFLNLMVVLVPFLLITAVFSRITILELSLPSGAGGSTDTKQQLSIEVIVREKGLEIGNGKQVLARFPLLSEGSIQLSVDDTGEIDTSKRYDLKLLSDFLVKIKGKYPDKTDAIVLMEPDIEYRVLISVMDAVRATFVRQTGEEGEADVLQQVVLFPDISIGDAP
ncbi:MAG: biopolymer transporter ExbD [Proteobacteria bacterium]|nr:biopolymer transporter ExbD [Pseudomonadota bacterium]